MEMVRTRHWLTVDTCPNLLYMDVSRCGTRGRVVVGGPVPWPADRAPLQLAVKTDHDTHDCPGLLPWNGIVGNVQLLTTEEERKTGRETFAKPWDISPDDKWLWYAAVSEVSLKCGWQ